MADQTRTGTTTIVESPSLFEALWRHWWLVGITATLGVLGGIIYSSVQSDEYRAEIEVLMRTAPTLDPFDSRFSQRQDDYIIDITKRLNGNVSAAAGAELNPDLTAEQIAGTSRGASGQGNSLTLVATGPTEELAVSTVNALADGFRATVRADTQAQADESKAALADLSAEAFAQLTDITARTQTLEAQIRDDLLATGAVSFTDPNFSAVLSQNFQANNEWKQLIAEFTEVDKIRDGYETRIRQIDTTVATFDDGVVRAGIATSAPQTQPLPKRNAAIGMAIGLLFGTAMAWRRAEQQPMQRTALDASELLHVPLVGEVPRALNAGRQPAPVVTAPSSDQASAHHDLLTSLMYRVPAEDCSVICVTSPERDRERSRGSLNLSLAALMNGVRVLLVDADYHGRELSKIGNVDQNPGLTELGRPGTTLDSVIVPLDFGDGRAIEFVAAGLGQVPPESFFRSPEFVKALDEARGRYDLVVIDSPPVLNQGHILAVAAEASAVITVVDPRVTSDRVSLTSQRLGLVGANHLGYVYSESKTLSFLPDSISRIIRS